MSVRVPDANRQRSAAPRDAPTAYDVYFRDDERDENSPRFPASRDENSPPTAIFDSATSDSASLRRALEESRRRHDALLASFHAETAAREASERRATEACADAEERAVAAEASAEDARAHAAEWRARLRAFESGSEHASLFERYERDVAALERECERARREWIDAEMLSATSTSTSERVHVADADEDAYLAAKGVGAEAGMAAVLASRDVQRRLDRLARALRTSEERLEHSRAECAELRRRERLMELHKRAHDDHARRLRDSETRARADETEIRRLRLAAAEADARRVEADRDAADSRLAVEDVERQLDECRAEAHRKEAKIHELEAAALERRRGAFEARSEDATRRANERTKAGARALVDVPGLPAFLRAAAELRDATPGVASPGFERAWTALASEIEASLERMGTKKGEKGEGEEGVGIVGDERDGDERDGRDGYADAYVEDERRRRGYPADPDAGGYEDVAERRASGKTPAPATATSAGDFRRARSPHRSVARRSFASRRLSLTPRARSPPPELAAAAAAAARSRTPTRRGRGRDGDASGGDSGAASASEGRVRTRSVEDSVDDVRFEGVGMTFLRSRSPDRSGRPRTADGSPEGVGARRTRPAWDMSPTKSRPKWEPMAGDPPPVPPSTYASSGIGRSPSPPASPGRSGAARSSPASPSSLARKPPGSPTRFYPAGAPTRYAHGEMRYAVGERGRGVV